MAKFGEKTKKKDSKCSPLFGPFSGQSGHLQNRYLPYLAFLNQQISFIPSFKHQQHQNKKHFCQLPSILAAKIAKIILLLANMVIHLPNQEYLRTVYNYSDMFMLTLLWNVGLIALLFGLLLIGLCITRRCMMVTIRADQLRASVITHDERKSHQALDALEDLPSPRQEEHPLAITQQHQTFKIVNILRSICFYLFLVALHLGIIVLYMFDIFGREILNDVFVILAMTFGMVVSVAIWKQKTEDHQRDLEHCSTEVSTTVGLLILWMIACVVTVVMAKGACFCYFTQDYGVQIQKDIYFSTEYMRRSELTRPCRQLEICHIYTTLPEDGSTSFFLNIHSGTDINNIFLTIKHENSLIENQTNPLKIRIKNIEFIGQRNVHTYLFQNLTPDTFYTLQLFNIDKDNQKLKQVRYRTLPGVASEVLRIAAGGDVGMNDRGKQMVQLISDFDPHVVILGGDIAYDNGMKNCYYNWDIFYKMFEPVYEKLGRLVPLVMSIGNHDAGFDSLYNISLDKRQENYPLFFVYNPQFLSNEGSVPSILDRKSLHYHLIGPIIHFSMDSGYLTSYSNQALIIEGVIKKHPDRYRFGNYHNPIFPTCADFTEGSNDMLTISEGRKWWVPLFDRNNFTAVLEHHTHYRKISFPLRNFSRSQGGTRYIGDGSWGVPNEVCPESDIPAYLDLFEDYELKKSSHFWQITIKKIDGRQEAPYEINYTAIGADQQIVMQKVQNLPKIQ